MKKADRNKDRKFGWLKNGNPPGDFSKAPRCGAKTRLGTSCRGPGMKNGRCRMHGGKSTGPKTWVGLGNSRLANFKHGHFAKSYHAKQEVRRRDNAMRNLEILRTDLKRIKHRRAGGTPCKARKK